MKIPITKSLYILFQAAFLPHVYFLLPSMMYIIVAKLMRIKKNYTALHKDQILNMNRKRKRKMIHDLDIISLTKQTMS